MFGLLKRNRRPSGFQSWDLSEPLIHWGKREPWTIGDACQGTQIFGSTGSGKSTGSVRALSLAMLRAGFGGLFLTAKGDDRATYEQYVKDAGCEDSLLVFSADNRLRFNFIDAEMRRSQS